MSQNLFQEIEHKLLGNGVSHGVFIRNENTQPWRVLPEKATQINPTNNETGFTWKPVTTNRNPYENEGNPSSAGAKYPARLGISDSSDEESMAEDLEDPKVESGEDDINATRPTQIPFHIPGSPSIHQVCEVGMNPEGAKRKNVNSKRNHSALYKIFFTLPEAYCLPGEKTRHPMDCKQTLKRCYNEAVGLPSHIEPQSLTMEERRKGYIEETRIRKSNGVHDKFCYHTETGLRFRSMKGVNEYILYGKVPGDTSLSRYQYYPKKLKRQIIGIFDFKTKTFGLSEEEINAATNDGGVELVEVEPLSGHMEQMEESVAGSSSTMIEKEKKYSNKNRTTFTVRKGLYMDFEIPS